MQAYAYPENRQPCADRSGCNAHSRNVQVNDDADKTPNQRGDSV